MYGGCHWKRSDNPTAADAYERSRKWSNNGGIVRAANAISVALSHTVLAFVYAMVAGCEYAAARLRKGGFSLVGKHT